jgi:hypothetical protein
MDDVQSFTLLRESAKVQRTKYYQSAIRKTKTCAWFWKQKLSANADNQFWVEYNKGKGKCKGKSKGKVILLQARCGPEGG